MYMVNMKAASLQQSRRLLQEVVSGDGIEAALPPEPLNDDNDNSTFSLKSRPFKPSSSYFDSSMALTILILLSALFFMGFFSVYIRRFSEDEGRRRRHPSPPPSPLRLVSKQKGLDPSTISALPLVSYHGAAKHGIIEDCTICLSEFQEGEMVKLIPQCRHVFHPRCIDTWLESHVSCPLCRSTQFFKSVDEVRLDVAQEKGSNGGDEMGERSTADETNTWRDNAVPRGIRRSCSCSSLADRAGLQRSSSF